VSPPTGVLPPEWLASAWYATLTAFVAVNTLVYVVLSVAKILPRAHPTTWLRRDGISRRRESRSIYPPGMHPAARDGAVASPQVD
jgi:hypothetical protein